jgi:hypothetical protein
MFSYNGCFSLVLLLLSQWWTPPLRLQVSACSTFLTMSDVPSMAVFVGNLLSVVLVFFPHIFKLVLLLLSSSLLLLLLLYLLTLLILTLVRICLIFR